MEKVWNMEWKIFKYKMEWKVSKGMEYGKFLFHSIACPVQNRPR